MAPGPSLVERVVARVSRRVPGFATAFEMKNRVDQVRGGTLAGAIALTSFLTIFPILLVAISVVALVDRNQDLAARAISQLSLTGSAADLVRDTLTAAKRSRKTTSVLGLAGLLWSGLGIVGAIETGFCAVWQVQGRGLKAKVFGLAWLAGAGTLLGASVALTAFLGTLPGPLAWLSLPATLVVDVGVWLWTFLALTNRPLPWRAHLPGAVLGAIGFELLKVGGAVYVPRLVAQSSALYGSLGVVFALLAWLALFARLTIFSAALNVVRWEQDHGTVTVEIDVPRMPGNAPRHGGRAGSEAPG